MKICYYNQNIGTCIAQPTISTVAIPTGSTTAVQNVSTFQSVEANMSDAHRIVLTEKPISTSLHNVATKKLIGTATSISGNYFLSKNITAFTEKMEKKPSDQFSHTTASITASKLTTFSKGISQGINFPIFLD